MKTNTHSVLLIVSLSVTAVLFSGCKSEEDLDVADPISTTRGLTVPSPEPVIRSIKTATEATVPSKSDPFGLIEASISGDVLKLVVEYSGGGKNHGWDLFWNGEILEKNPPLTYFRIVHDARGDSAEAIITKEIFFDLTFLRAEASGQISIQFVGIEKEVLYSY